MISYIDPAYSQEYLWILIVAFIVAFILAFAMGANDCANSYGPSVGSGVLTLIKAYLCASVFEVLGAALLGYKVTKTIRKEIVDLKHYDVYCLQNQTDLTICEPVQNCSYWSSPDVALDAGCHKFTHPEFLIGALGTLIGCAIFMMTATVIKMPVSTTHSIIGSTMGFSLVLHGVKGINWITVVKIAASWVISPFLAGFFSVVLYAFIKFFGLNRKNPLEACLATLPFLFFFTIFINIFTVLYGGSKFLRFNLPIWADLIIALLVAGIVALIIRFIAILRIRKSVIAYLQRKPFAASKTLHKSPSKVMIDFLRTSRDKRKQSNPAVEIGNEEFQTVPQAEPDEDQKEPIITSEEGFYPDTSLFERVMQYKLIR